MDAHEDDRYGNNFFLICAVFTMQFLNNKIKDFFLNSYILHMDYKTRICVYFPPFGDIWINECVAQGKFTHKKKLKWNKDTQRYTDIQYKFFMAN
jgi:hypothetical protein